MRVRLITVKKFSEIAGVALPRGYELARRLPHGVRVKLGRQIRINEEALVKWIEEGGTLSKEDSANESCLTKMTKTNLI